MKDDTLISRKATLERLRLLAKEKHWIDDYWSGNFEAQCAVNTMETVQVNRRAATWLLDVPADGSVGFVCSSCGGSVPLEAWDSCKASEGFGKYCPFCGAEMVPIQELGKEGWKAIQEKNRPIPVTLSEGENYPRCPRCKECLIDSADEVGYSSYCPDCGQALDWSDYFDPLLFPKET